MSFTKLQKQRMKLIRKMDDNKNYFKDAWNNYHLLNNNDIRYKIKKNVIVKQIKLSGSWTNIKSTYIKDC